MLVEVTATGKRKIHHIPNKVDRNKIHNMIKLNAHGLLLRTEIDEAIARILVSYGLSKIYMKEYTVHLKDPIETPTGIWPVVHVEAHRWSKDEICPNCGGESRYLEGGDTFSPWVMMCLDCGTVFKFMEERRKSDESVHNLRTGLRNLTFIPNVKE